MDHRPSAIHGILFDKDGTLVDYTATWAPINREAATVAAGGEPGLARHLLTIGGHDPDRDVIRSGSLLAASHTEEIAQAWVEAGAVMPADRLTRELDRIFTEGAQNAVAVPDLPALFETLHGAGIRTGLATSDSAAGARATLTAIGLDGMLDFVVGYDSGHGGKPGPGMAEAFCRATGLAPDQALMVGDNLHDIDMGRNAGFSLCLGVLTGTGSESDFAERANGVLADVTGLPAWLREHERWPVDLAAR